MITQIHPNKIRQVLFLTIIILLGVLVTKELYFALAGILGAITLYVVLRIPLYKLLFKYKWKKWQAILLLMLGTFLLIMLPIIWLGSLGFQKISPIVQNPTPLYEAFEKMHTYLLNNYSLDILNKEYIAKLNAQLLPFVKNLLGSTLTSFGTLFLSFLFLFFMLSESIAIEKWLLNYMPFKSKNVNKIIADSRNIVFSNAIGIPIVAILQGVVGFIGYWIFGAPQFVLMGLLTAICSVIPVVGSMIIFIPLMIYKLAEGDTYQGIAIGIWGLVVVGSVDNIARFMLQKKLANVHPLNTIFGVIVGVNLFGFWGIVFGPLLLSLLFLLIKIYIDEFGTVDADEIGK
jgi:predicted PurR-regulated permease PerM